jgi:uncharacterized repeat protein (TIGR01451 family)
MRRVFLASAIIIFLSTVLFVSSVGQPDRPAVALKPPATTAQVLAAKNLPLEFIPNAGQTDSRVSFYIKGSDRTVYFTPDGVTLALYKKPKAEQPIRGEVSAGTWEMGIGPTESWVVKIDFIGAQKGVVPEGLDKTGAVFSYFKGRPKDWHAGLPGYRRIVYRDLWPGIDLVYKGDVGRLKYEFIVAPGADPGLIQFGIRGAKDVTVDRHGWLVLETPLENIADEKPYVYQEGLTGEKKTVEAAYKVKKTSAGDAQVGFFVADYDRSLPLVVDPATLVYCGYIGGSSEDYGDGIAVDSSGNAYVTGETFSQAAFPVTVGPDLTHSGYGDAFVAKVKADGTGLVYCGYIGGIGEDRGLGIALDSSGNAYVAGLSRSDEQSFPVIVGPDLTYNGGNNDAFVAKINASGTGLVYCGYVGGASGEYGSDIAVDGTGNAYVTGCAGSDQTSFPITIGPDLTYNGSYDAFVAKVKADGTGLVYCGYIGGSGEDIGDSIAVDSSGNAYVTGYTTSDQATFPATVGPDLTYNGNKDAFVAKVNASGTDLVYCGYIGGAAEDRGLGIALDSSGNAYITGYTSSDQTSFPVLVGPDLTHNGNGDAFVAKVEADGTHLVYCGYIGSAGGDSGHDIAVDGTGNAYITGSTESSGMSFLVTASPHLTYKSFKYIYVAKINASGTGLVFLGYIGGSEEALGLKIALDNSGNAYVAGETRSDQYSFPVMVGPDLTYNGGYTDAFVAKVANIAGFADISLAKSTDNLQPFVGDSVSFTITVTNFGPQNATGVKVSDKLPDGLSFLSADVAQGTYDPDSGLWTLGVLPDQASAAMTLQARVDKDGTITNRVTLSEMNEFDPELTNNEASVSLAVPPLPGALSVTPSDGLSPSGIVGGPFSPSSKDYTLQNTGGVSINWTASKGQSWVTLSQAGGTLAPGGSTTVTVSINSNANSLSANTYTDTVTFTNTTNGTGNTTRPVSLTINAVAMYNLVISASTGSPASGNGGTTSPEPSTYQYASGDSILISALANSAYRFCSWDGDVPTIDKYSTTITITLDGNKSITANFCSACGDVNGTLSITPGDAQMAFDIYLGKIATPTTCQLENADVNCSGTKSAANVTPGDAQRIFDKYLGKSDLPCSCSGQSRTVSLAQNIYGHTNRSIVLEDVVINSDETDISIPIIINNPSKIKSFGFDIAYQDQYLQFITFEKSAFLDGFEQVDANQISNGIIRIGGYSSEAVKSNAAGVFLTLIFKIKKRPIDSTHISIMNLVDDVKMAVSKSGKITLK